MRMERELKAERIGVLCGGMSGEREVSLRSGENVYQACRRLGLDCVKIDVDTDIAASLRDEKITLAYIALHGKWGEDGCVQGLLELLRIPYTGSGVMASAIGMNKLYTKRILEAEGIPVPGCVVIDQADPKGSAEEAIKRFGLPLVAKPVEEGSSIAVTIAHDRETLLGAARDLAQRYHQSIIECFIAGKEITTGVLGTGSAARALPILGLEPVAGKEFYDYEAKYTPGMTRFILPADLPPEITRRAQDLAVQVHRTIGCRGVSRVDAMVQPDGAISIIEINTLPGMTATSDLPAEAAEAGISFDGVVERILLSALEDCTF
ncbi:MAG TPA: D-alanine--D-alanine ligase [Spirochaetota bacterium]|nr:D-alanine--D-alanine ligase [Spirochaetota bacterium]